MLKKYNSEFLIYIGICLMLWVYLVMRIIHIPLVHDEAVTFFNYIATGKFVPFNLIPKFDWKWHEDANNHFLNSLLSHYSYKAFGSAPWAVRLPSVLFAGLFFTYIWRIGQWLEDVKIRWVFFLAFLGAHYLVEFFSVTRGYGMSIALLLGAIYHLFRYMKEYQTRDLVWYGVLMTLALLANLTLVNTALIGWGLIVLLWIFHGPEMRLIRDGIVALFLVLAPLAAAIGTGYQYKEMGLLYYGQGESYWDVTVRSFFDRFTLLDSEVYVLPIFLPLLLLMLVLFVQRAWNLKWDGLKDKPALFAAFFFGNLAASIIQTSFMDVNYPEDRTALFFYPFMAGMFCFVAETRGWLKWTLIPFLFFPIQFLFTINTTHNSFWANERIPTRFYTQILDNYEETGVQPIVSGYHIRQVAWDYHNYRHGGDLSRLHYGLYPNDTIADFHIMLEKDGPYLERLYDKIDEDPISELCLFKRKEPVTRELFHERENTGHRDNNIYEFSNFVDFRTDTMPFNEVLVEFEFDFFPHHEPFLGWLVVQGFDETGQQTMYAYIPLNRLRPDYHTEHHVKHGLYTETIPKGTVRLKAYLWNLNHARFSLWNSHTRLYGLGGS